MRFLALLILTITTTAASTATADPLKERFSATLRGSVLQTSNVILECSTASAGCTDARDVTGGRYQNSQFEMVNVDVDANASTFNSSLAKIDLNGATVVWAGLYWGGALSDFGRPDKYTLPPTPADADTVTIVGPNGGDRVVVGNIQVDNGHYQGFADVTDFVSDEKSGAYTVANIQATTGRWMFGGWSLIVVVEDAARRYNDIKIFDGFEKLNAGSSVNLDIAEFRSEVVNGAAVRMGYVTYDGDKGSSDLMWINGRLMVPKEPVRLDPNPAGDVMNSTITTDWSPDTSREPAYPNTFGFDADRFDATDFVGTDSDLNIEWQTAGDNLFIGAFTIESQVPGRIIQTDWSAGEVTSATTIGPERGFLSSTGNLFWDTTVGDLRALQFAYQDDNGRYELLPVRNTRTDTSYYGRYSNATSFYPFRGCRESKFFLYRESDSGTVSWVYGVNQRNAQTPCNGEMDATYDIKGSASVVLSDENGESTLTGFDHFWLNQYPDGHVIRFADAEWSVAGTIDRQLNDITHEMVLDESNTVAPLDISTPGARWSFQSLLTGRLESVVFDAGSPQMWGTVELANTLSADSKLTVYVRAGSTEAAALSAAWEGPFATGDVVGNANTNGNRFIQYAIDTSLGDPDIANGPEALAVLQEIVINFSSGVIATAGDAINGSILERTFTRRSSNGSQNQMIDSDAWTGPKSVSATVDALARSNDATDEPVVEPSIAEQPSCSSIEANTSGWMLSLLLIGLVRIRRRKSERR